MSVSVVGRRPFAASLALGALSLVACSSVEVPTETFYRLQLPAATSPDPQRAGTLRIMDLQLGTALDSDRLLRQSGVRLEPRLWSRWVAPLDRLVTDALVPGLSRARVCDLVKGSADPGDQTWSLHGRIIDFVEASDDEGQREARVALELWLERDGQLLFHDEFAVTEPLLAPGADAAVAALSRGLQTVVQRVVDRMRARQLFAAAYAEQEAAVLARPPR